MIIYSDDRTTYQIVSISPVCCVKNNDIPIYFIILSHYSITPKKCRKVVVVHLTLLGKKIGDPSLPRILIDRLHFEHLYPLSLSSVSCYHGEKKCTLKIMPNYLSVMPTSCDHKSILHILNTNLHHSSYLY